MTTHEGVSVMGDIGHMTFGVRANVMDLASIWGLSPERRQEFKQRELHDLREAHLTLTLLLSAIEVSEDKEAA